MDRRTFVKTLPALTLLAGAMPAFAQEASAPAPPAAAAPASGAGDLKPIELPKPEADGGKSVLAALHERKTNRSIKPDMLPLQTLSNLLWAAWGVNRGAVRNGLPGRTAASASNSQEMDLYVALAEGVYLYDAVPHRLVPVAAGDLRALAGGRGRGRGGAASLPPVRLIFVVDLAKYKQGQPQEPGLKDSDIQKLYYGVATGMIAQNVYLFAASQGLAAWFHNCNKPELTKALKLRPEQKVLFAQTVGFPA